jgi:ankyrin repeat protein
MKANVECVDKELQTPLYYAIKRGDMQIIRYLVEEVRVNIHHEEHQKRNVIYLGAFEGNLEVVKYLY